MARLPFSVFKREGRRFYYVKFKKKSGQYAAAVSTKQTSESEAIETAFKWLREGKPARNVKNDNAVSISLSLRETLRSIKTTAEVEFACKELKQQGLLKSYVISESKQAADFSEYLQNFWDYDTSPYVKEKLRKNHGIHRNYTVGQKLSVERYWMPFFRDRLLGDITRQDIENFMDNLETLARRTV